MSKDPNNNKPNGFVKRRESKKRDILAAARKLLFSKGLKETTVAELAGEAKVSQVSIYNFFGSKENLARQVFIDYMNESLEQLQQVTDSDHSFQEKVRMLWDMSAALAGRMTPNAYLSLNWDDPLLKEFQEEYAMKRVLPEMMRLIEQGKREGQVSPAIDSATVLLYMNAFGQMITAPGVVERWDPQQREQLGQLFFYGLFGQASSESGGKTEGDC